MVSLLPMQPLLAPHHLTEQLMLSNTDSFPIKSIRTSGIESMDNPSKNTQTHILGKKVKAENKFQTHKMRCTIFKDNFRYKHSKYQVIVLLERKKYYFSIYKIILLSLTFWQKVNVNRAVSAGIKASYFQSQNVVSLQQII